MPTMQDVRTKYPQYQDMSDAALADALHRKFYSDMPRADFDAKIDFGVSQPSQVSQASSEMPAPVSRMVQLRDDRGVPVGDPVPAMEGESDASAMARASASFRSRSFFGENTTQPPADPSYGGVGMNTTAGMNEALYGSAGLPVDLAAGAMNAGVRGINAVTGAELPTIDQPFGGSRSIASAAGAAHPVLDPQNTQAATVEDRLARGTGQGIAGTILPAGIVGGAARAGLLRQGGAAVGTQIFGRSGSVGAVAGDAALGAAAGAGSAAGQEMVSEKYRTLGGLGGGIVGGGLGAAAIGLPSLVAGGFNLGRDAVAPLTAGGRERLAAQRLRDAASDPAALRTRLEEGSRPVVPGSEPTTFQATGDMGLGALERESATRFPAEFMQRAADQNTARRAALDGIQPGGAAEDVTRALRSRLAAIEAETDGALQAAQDGARTSAGAIGAGMAPEAAGERMRASLGQARAEAKAKERALWSAVDPDGSLIAPTSGLRQTAQQIAAELPASARPPAGEEAAILGVLGGYGDAMPFREVTALRSRLNDALREERRANGESVVYRRLSMMRGALEGDLDAAISGRVAQEAEAVAAGTMRQQDTLEARWMARAEDRLAGREQQAATGFAGGAGASSFAGGGSIALPGSVGTGGQAGRRPGGVAGDPRLPPELPLLNFDGAARERLTAATTATRERAGTFDNPTLGPLRRPAADMPSSSIPGRIFFPQAKSVDAIRQFRQAVGDAEALPVLEDYAADRLRRVALREDGTMDPGKLAAWRRAHADPLRELPGLDARVADAGRAAEMVTEATARRVARLDQAKAGALGRIMGVDDPGDVSRIVGGLFSRQDAAAQFSGLRRAIGDDLAGQAGLRRAVADHVAQALVANTEGGTSGQALLRSDQFQTFVRRNGAALREAGFSDAEIGTMQAIADDLQRANRSASAVRLPGQSNTAQDLTAVGRNDGAASILAKVVYGSSLAGGGASLATGSMTGTAAAIGAGLFQAMRERGIRRVDELVRDAILDPATAKLLLAKVKPGQEASLERTLAQRYRAATTAMIADEEREGREREARQEQPRGIRIDVPLPAGSPGASMGPRAALEEPQTPQQMMAALLIGDAALTAAPDPRTMALAAALRSGGGMPAMRGQQSAARHMAEAMPKGGPDDMNRMQREYIARQLLNA